MPRPHQPGQSVFQSILPEEISWQHATIRAV